MNPKRKRIAIALTALTVLTAVGATAALFVKIRKDRSACASTAAAPTLVAVDAAVPGRKTLHRYVEVFGSLSPKTATEIKSELLGRVHRAPVKEWDAVKPGDVLLEIDPTDSNMTVRKEEAGLKMARAQVLQAKVDVSRAKREYDRATKLKQGGLVTGQELDDRKSALESAEAKVALAEAQAAQADAMLAEARHNLDKTKIRAPIEGVISRRQADVGDFVDKGTPLFTIVDNRILDFTANVSAPDLADVFEGQTLAFTVDGIPGRSFQGRIKRVNPLVSSADRSGRIQAEVENGDGVLKGGLFARGQVLVEERKDAMVLPSAALIGWNLEKATARVFVVDSGGIARTRNVGTGLPSGDMVEIASGLAGDEKVVVRGGFNLRDGDEVSVSASGEIY